MDESVNSLFEPIPRTPYLLELAQKIPEGFKPFHSSGIELYGIKTRDSIVDMNNIVTYSLIRLFRFYSDLSEGILATIYLLN